MDCGDASPGSTQAAQQPEKRSFVVLTRHEKEQDFAGEVRPGGDRAALFHEKEPQHSTAQVQE